MKHLFFIAVSALLSLALHAQESRTNVEVEKWRIGESNYIGSGLLLGSDGNSLIITHTQGFPIYFYDLAKRTIERTVEIQGYYAGPRPLKSNNDSLVLLEQQFYLDLSPNRDKPVEYEVRRLSDGGLVLKIDKAHSASFTPDSKQLLALEGDEVVVYNLLTGAKEKSFKVDRLAWSLLVAPDGKSFYASHEPTEGDLENIPAIRNDRKSWKSAIKYRDAISQFDISTGKRIALVPEIYDPVYTMKTCGTSHTLYIYSRPHIKLKPQGYNEGYVTAIDMKSNSVLKQNYMTREVNPDFSLSPDGVHMAIITKEKSWPQLHVYDVEKNELVSVLDISRSLGQLIKEREFGDGRAYVVWTPDGDILMLCGNHLLKWDPI
jgi:hypothetical protein